MAIYITCIDKFMSGWGLAKDMDNRLIFECKDEGTANRLRNKLESRSEMAEIEEIEKVPDIVLKDKEVIMEGEYVQMMTPEKFGVY